MCIEILQYNNYYFSYRPTGVGTVVCCQARSRRSTTNGGRVDRSSYGAASCCCNVLSSSIAIIAKNDMGNVNSSVIFITHSIMFVWHASNYKKVNTNLLCRQPNTKCLTGSTCSRWWRWPLPFNTGIKRRWLDSRRCRCWLLGNQCLPWRSTYWKIVYFILPIPQKQRINFSRTLYEILKNIE